MDRDHVDRFEILEERDRDGLSVTYRARDTRLGRPVWLRVLNTPEAAGPEAEYARARFLEQTRVAALLEHPHIPFLMEAGEEDSVPYAVYEARPGTVLRERLELAGPLHLHEAIAIGRKVTDALCVAHEAGAYHGNLSIGDVLVTPTGGVCVLRLHQPAPDEAAALQRLEATDLRSTAKVLWAMLRGVSAPLPTGIESADNSHGVPYGLVRVVASCVLGDRAPVSGAEIPRTCHDLRALLGESALLDPDPAAAALIGFGEPPAALPFTRWAIGAAATLSLLCLLTQTWQLGALGVAAAAASLLAGAGIRGLVGGVCGAVAAIVCLLASHV